MSAASQPEQVPAATRFASLATAATIVCVLLSIVFDWATLLAGVAAIAMLCGAFLVATPRTRVVVALLVGIGLASAVFGVVLFGSSFELTQLGRLNQDLVAMLAGGAFIRGVVSTTKRTPKPRLTGAPAVLRTAYVSHFMGSVLNMVSIGIVGDHLQRRGKLSVNNASLIVQSFSTGALWSPFWTVSALVVAYFPTVALLPISATGLMFGLVLLGLGTLWNISRRTREELADPGYALQPSILALPLALIACVVVGHALLPETPVPRIVLLASLLVPFALGIARAGIKTTAKLYAQVASGGLTGSANEFALFVAAGVFTIGGSMLTTHLPFQLSSVPPSVFTAWLLTVAITLLSVFGVHPIISISVASALALFVPEGGVLYAAAVLWGWCIASPVGPLAGTVIYVSGRFHVKERELIASNIPFAVLGLALAFPAIYVASQLSSAWGFG